MKNRVLVYLGMVCFFVWVIDVINNIFYVHKPEYLLWYSTFGLLLTGISLMTQNKKLIAISFCAFFVIELVWDLGFLLKLFIHVTIPGVAEYMFASTYKRKDFLISLYHLLISPSLLLAVIINKEYYKYAWVGALSIATVLAFLTYFFVNPHEQVNCVHTINYCRTFIPFLNTIHNPLRIFVGLFLATVVIYIPSNYWMLLISKKRN
jgi:hypothetical protein